MPQSEAERKWRSEHPEIVREWDRKAREKCRLEVIAHYSDGSMSCLGCQTTDLRVLTIDHIKGGGNAHRREIRKKGGVNFYFWLRQQGYPEGYRVLCHNCNYLAKTGEVYEG